MSSTPEVPTISGLTHVIAGTAHSPCYARSNYGWRSPAHVLTISHLILSFLQLIVCVCSLILPTRRRKQLIKKPSRSLQEYIAKMGWKIKILWNPNKKNTDGFFVFMFLLCHDSTSDYELQLFPDFIVILKIASILINFVQS